MKIIKVVTIAVFLFSTTAFADDNDDDKKDVPVFYEVSPHELKKMNRVFRYIDLDKVLIPKDLRPESLGIKKIPGQVMIP